MRKFCFALLLVFGISTVAATYLVEEAQAAKKGKPKPKPKPKPKRG